MSWPFAGLHQCLSLSHVLCSSSLLVWQAKQLKEEGDGAPVAHRPLLSLHKATLLRPHMTPSWHNLNPSVVASQLCWTHLCCLILTKHLTHHHARQNLFSLLVQCPATATVSTQLLALPCLQCSRAMGTRLLGLPLRMQTCMGSLRPFQQGSCKGSSARGACS